MKTLSQKEIQLMKSVLIVLVSVVVFGFAIKTDTQEEKSEPRAEFSSEPLDWERDFGGIDWQKSVGEICNEDFTILRQGKDGVFGSCTFGRYIHTREIKLAELIMKVVSTASPSGYKLSGIHGDSRDVWVEDLNRDGDMDMAFMLIPEDSSSRTLKLLPGALFAIVTPINMDGTSEGLLEVSGEYLMGLGPILYQLRTNDFRFEELVNFQGTNVDHKELVIPGIYANDPLSFVFKVDYNQGILKIVELKDPQGARPLHIGEVNSINAALSRLFFRDVDGGNEEYIEVLFEGEPFEKPKIEEVRIYKWNGEVFELQQSVSEPGEIFIQMREFLVEHDLIQ